MTLDNDAVWIIACNVRVRKYLKVYRGRTWSSTVPRLTVFHRTPEGLAKLDSERQQARSLVPQLTNLQIQRLTLSTGYACFRLVTYLQNNQGAATASVSRDIAIANVSDVAQKEHHNLARMGLNIECKMLDTVNRYGAKIRVGTWWIKVTDHGKYFGIQAANDS
jgi:hypothetical protein